MDLGVLAATGSWYVRDLQRAAANRHRVVPLDFAALRSQVGCEATRVMCNGQDLTSFDALLVRTMPPGSLEQVVFRMDALGRIEAAGGIVVNPARAIEAAVDKYLALAKLQAAGMPVPATVACQTTDEALAVFQQLGGDVVIKPLFGAEGRGICRVSDPDLALRACRMLEQMNAVIYLQEFIEHEGFDFRLFVIGERVLGMRRRSATDWRTNVSRGAAAEPLVVDDRLADLGRRAARAVGASIAGVDVLPARDGRLLLLEVNAVPGWQALSRALELDVAAIVLEFMETLVAKRGGTP